MNGDLRRFFERILENKRGFGISAKNEGAIRDLLDESGIVGDEIAFQHFVDRDPDILTLMMIGGVQYFDDEDDSFDDDSQWADCEDETELTDEQQREFRAVLKKVGDLYFLPKQSQPAKLRKSRSRSQKKVD